MGKQCCCFFSFSIEDECRDDEFDCGEKVCIASNLVCDRRKDCPSGADEEGCPSEPCQDTEFRCGDGQCIPNYLVCSGTPECNDRSDERECGKLLFKFL